MAVPQTHTVHCIIASGADQVKVADTSNEIDKCFRICRIRKTIITPPTQSATGEDSPLENLTSAIPSPYLWRIFCVLSPYFYHSVRKIPLGIYFANSTAGSWLQYRAFLSFLIIPHYLLASFRSFFSSFFPIPSCLPFIFFSILVLLTLTLIRCGASTLVRLSQIRSKYNCNVVKVCE